MKSQWFRMAYLLIVRTVIRMILFVIGTLKITGQENIPEKGPYIAVTNHLSMADPVLVLISLPRQQMRVFAANKWRRHIIFGTILSLSGAIWVKRGEVDRTALREAIKSLKEGQVLGMAPEGTRSRTHVLQEARQGAAYIASRAQVPILPIGIVNSEEFLSNVMHFKRTHFEVRIGKPFESPDLGNRPKSRELSVFTKLIMTQIAYLLPERYHGFYANSKGLIAMKNGGDPWEAIIENHGSVINQPTSTVKEISQSVEITKAKQ